MDDAFWLMLNVQALPAIPGLESLPDVLDEALNGSASESGTTSFQSGMVKFSESFPGILFLLEVLCYLAGIYFVIGAILKMRELTYQGSHGIPAKVSAQALSGMMLVAAPATISTVSNTMFAASSCTGDYVRFMDYLDGCTVDLSAVGALMGALVGAQIAPGYAMLATAVVQFIQVIGFIAFFRGWTAIVKSTKIGNGQGDDLFWSGVVRIFAGVACVHINDIVLMINATFGFS